MLTRDANARRLPQIRTDLASSLATVHAALKELPPPPSADPIAELHARLAALGRDLDLLVQGASGHAELVQSKNREDQRYKVNIRATRPRFIPFTKTGKDKSARAAWEEKNPHNDKAGVEALTMDLDELHRHIEE